ncbi:MAG: hypothetical protein EPO08_10965 [Rhodospirillaceae bacterium]|nr:MAG: hypothetical protein EPO08_10965 [Rhodospirillaceae bacterium]
MMLVQGLSIRRRGVERWRYRGLLALPVVFALAACATDSNGNTVFSSPQEPKTVNVPTATVTPEAVAAAATPSSSNFGVTVVGQKVAQFRNDFEKLKANTETRSAQLDTIRAQTVTNVEAYHALVGGIRSRLQMGSTPGNPELLAQWNQAQTQLTQIDSDVQTLDKLSAQVSADAATSAYLLDSIRASYSLSGALEEDHRQLRILEDEVDQNAIVIDRALQGLNDEINRQQQYVTNERTSLVALAADINAGQSYGMAMRRAAPARDMAPASAPQQGFGERRPLVVIRFDKPDVAYEPALYQALSRALERRPDAVFDLVAVSPDGGSAAPAKQRADAVLKSMTGMGLPSDRVSESAMASATAKTPEVHIYVR